MGHPTLHSALVHAALGTRLGPGRVVSLEGQTPTVEFEGTPVRAELALAFPYEPSVGDELLIIGQLERHYVIGVLRARGVVSLRFMGDVTIASVGGRLDLQGDTVRVRAQNIEFTSRSVKTWTENIVERAKTVYRRVQETLDVHTGETRELCDGTISTRAETLNTCAAGVIAFNGKQIHLG